MEEKTNEIIVTIQDIEDSLCDLDTEYREALATTLIELNYISDTPLQLQYGTMKQREELKNIWEKPLKSKQVKDIIKYISDEMKDDFQYGQFKEIASEYMDISNAMNKNEEEQKRRNMER